MKDFLRKVAFVGLIFVVIFGCISYKEVIIAFSEPVDIFEDFPEDYNDVKAVETEINMIYDCFAEEETTTTNRRGAVTNRSYDYYYILPVYTESENEEYYVALKASQKDRAKHDKIVDTTIDYLFGDAQELQSTKFQGGFIKMEDEIYKYFEEWFQDVEWFESSKELKKYVLPLVLEPVNYAATKKFTFIMIGVLVVSILLFLLSFKVGNKKQHVVPQKAVITINGVNYPTSNFEQVNKLVEKGKKAKAVKELMVVTGISEADANAVILDWYAYWR